MDKLILKRLESKDDLVGLIRDVDVVKVKTDEEFGNVLLAIYRGTDNSYDLPILVAPMMKSGHVIVYKIDFDKVSIQDECLQIPKECVISMYEGDLGYKMEHDFITRNLRGLTNLELQEAIREYGI